MPATERLPARERILDVADRLFYAHGIHAVGVDAIVAESGAAKTTLYSHFRSKDELIAAYLRRRSERGRAHLDAELAAHGGPAAGRLLHVFDLLGAWFADPDYRGCPFINACAEFDAEHAAAAVVREHRELLKAMFAALAKEAGAGSPDLVATQVMLLYDGAMVRAHIDGTPAAAQAAKAAAEMLLRNSSASGLRNPAVNA
jgi:AcrR family transcriptional regulator